MRRQRPLRAPPAGEWLGSPNYTAGRPARPDRILLHHMAGSLVAANARFQNAAASVSAHYGVAWVDARRTVEWVHPDDVAWHAGDWPYNQRSVGIETETDPRDWHLPRPDSFYDDVAALVAALSREYGIAPERLDVSPPGPCADHRDVVATACPGTLDADRVRRQARSILTVATPIMGASLTSSEQVRAFLAARAPAAPASYATLLMLIAAEFGVRAEVMLAQTCHETGYFTYGGDVRPDWNNFAGIGITGAGAVQKFESVELGIVAHAAHLAWYATSDHVGPRCSKTYDPRHFGAHRDSAHDVRELGGKWAPSLQYGERIAPVVDAILGTMGGDMAYVTAEQFDSYKRGLQEQLDRDYVRVDALPTLRVSPIAPPTSSPRTAAPRAGVDDSGHGPGIANPPRGPRATKRPTRAREATR